MATTISGSRRPVHSKKLNRLSKKLGDCWDSLGIQLGVGVAQIDSIRSDNVQYASVRRKAFAMLIAWRDKEGKAATYEVLAEALRRENKNGLAERYCKVEAKFPRTLPTACAAMVVFFLLVGASLPLTIKGHSAVQRDGESLSGPPVEEIMAYVAGAYLESSSLQNRADFDEFRKYLKDIRGLIIGSEETSSLRITVTCTSLEILEDLWQDYTSGGLNEAAERYLVTEEILRKYGLKEFRLVTIIDEEDYKRCKAELEELEGRCARGKIEEDVGSQCHAEKCGLTEGELV